MRNVAARIDSAGGSVEVRSAPGAGTTVEGYVPVPDVPVPEVPEVPVAEPLVADVPVPELPVAGSAVPAAAEPVGLSPLLEGVLAAVRAARALYRDTPAAESLQSLAGHLTGPLRIVVVGTPGAARDVEMLVDTLLRGTDPGALLVGRSDLPGMPLVDARLLVLDGTGPGGISPALLDGGSGMLSPTQTIGVLVDGGWTGGGPGSRPGSDPLPEAVRRLCGTVIPAYRRDSGLTRLRELVDTSFVARAELLKARTGLRTLEALVRTVPPAGDGRSLLYLLDRTRSASHELAELDLLDALHLGDLRLPEDQQRAAERLLGGEGAAPWARLGCRAEAAPEELAQAAAAQLSRWQRSAAHPASTAATRAVAAVLQQTCQRLL
jgi:hypothetical protein